MVGTFGDAAAFSFYPTRIWALWVTPAPSSLSSLTSRSRPGLLRMYGWRSAT